jgi:hypothetical protein
LQIVSCAVQHGERATRIVSDNRPCITKLCGAEAPSFRCGEEAPILSSGCLAVDDFL